MAQAILVSQGSFFGNAYNAVVEHVKVSLAKRAVYSQTSRELSALSDRELADLGIARSAIQSIAHEAAYGA